MTLIVNCIFTFTYQSNAKEWRWIIPLKSTRSDVKRLLGEATDLNFYKFDTERAWIFYNPGGLTGNDCISKSPKDVVTRISVSPNDIFLLESLNLDLTKFEKKRSLKYLYTTAYNNEEEGVVYEVNEHENNDINEITYLPSKKDCEEILKR